MKSYVRIIVLQALLVPSAFAQGQTGPSQSLLSSWNLVGDSSPVPLDPVTTFGNATSPLNGVSNQIATVWAWDAPNSRWMFFAPSLDPTGLASYADGKGYAVLPSIVTGEGYWVNAKAPLTITLASPADGQTPASRTLVPGWNLVANNSAVALDPVAVFGNVTTPLSGITNQITTVWAWDRVNAKWRFFTPSLDAVALATYASGKAYAVLGSIFPGDGYWVNAAAAVSFVLPPTLSGIAASGGPITNAAVTLNCSDGSTKTATTDANGAYAISLGTCGAPYVLSVTGVIGDAEETLVSVHPNAMASSDSSFTVNATPLTHALAATVASSGDPLDLIDNYSAQKANITAVAVHQRKTALTNALANILTTAGIDPAKFDLVNTRFNADRSGLDKVLDNVKVQVMPTGVSMTNVGAVQVDDMGDAPPAAPAADLSGGTISFNTATDFTVALPNLPSALDDHSIGDAIRDALNAC
ncbi:MAG: carboxypeptidase-like regulatory domain-containing protein, partial [Betaproteobacteria bacterium]